MIFAYLGCLCLYHQNLLNEPRRSHSSQHRDINLLLNVSSVIY